MIEIYEEIGDQHILTSLNTPLRDDAFNLSDDEKIEQIQDHFRSIMNILGLDLNDDSLKGTPYRVAKMYVKEIFSGLNPLNKPKIALFDNKYKYNEMLIEKNILLQSTCEHHFLPIYGKAHIAYFPKNNVIGLSKINRIVQHFAKRPQVQERLSIQLLEDLKKVLASEDVAVYIDAKHMCVSSRGIKDTTSSTVTTAFSGKFKDAVTRKEFLSAIHNNQEY
ncbi:MAG: GTP cyclohydrolase I FolE [Saprospiraceae bacterium]|nr:GTP cyclohydrolase I FolE [Saprospiraceae bacterium]